MQIDYRTQFGDLLAHFGLSGHAVEIGVAEGRNAQVLIASPRITKLYMIDSWTHLEQSGDGGYEQAWHENNLIEAQQRVADFKEKAVILRGLSSQMIEQIPDDSLVFAYIDGDHSYNGVLTDLTNVYRKVKSGGIIAGHDYLNLRYGVNRAVANFLHNVGPRQVNVTTEDGDENMVSFWLVR